MKHFVALAGFILAMARTASAAYPDRLVWVFGWNLNNDSEVGQISQVLDTAAAHGINGAMVSFGLDTLCKKSPQFFQRLDQAKQACDRDKIEMIPAIFSVGYGSAALAHNRNLAEGVPVIDAPFVVKGDEARLVPDGSVRIANGDFEKFNGNTFPGFGFHDQPGTISFVDTDVKHSGRASIRLENFTANQYGHGRVSQKIAVRPHRCYRMSLWVKTENLAPAGAFHVMALANGRELAPRTFNLPFTADWRKITMLFNSMDQQSVQVYAGMWGGKSGKLWIDDWTIEEVGPLNVLHRPGTPVTVKSEDGATTYTEGKDYVPLVDPGFGFTRVDREAVALHALPDGRIKDGQRLLVTWYHPMIVHDGQITVCMGEPELYEIFDEEAKLLADRLHPKRIMLNMDEIRMGGTCAACRGRNMGELLGECITKQVEILRKHMPGVQVYIWSDMLDPNHNAHGNYYLVEGDYTGSWKHVPRDLTIAVWGGPVRPKSLKFFADEGFKTIVACYYDADDLRHVKDWIDLARQTRKVQGFMYTPWQKTYGLLGEFGELIKE